MTKQEYQKIYRRENKDKVKAKRRANYLKNREAIIAETKAYAKTHPEVKRKARAKWLAKPENKLKRLAYLRKYDRARRKSNPKLRVDANMSRSIRKALAGNKNGRPWETLVNFSLDQLKTHLEEQFDETMSWDNYGTYWHIDHIKPRCSFNYTQAEEGQFKECWSLDNLRPLNAAENIRKAQEDKKLKTTTIYEIKRIDGKYGSGVAQNCIHPEPKLTATAG